MIMLSRAGQLIGCLGWWVPASEASKQVVLVYAGLRAVHYLEIDQAGLAKERFLVDSGAVQAGGFEPNDDPSQRYRVDGRRISPEDPF